MRDAGVKNGLPSEAIHCLTEFDDRRHRSADAAKKTAVILATGGIGLVRAAYSSGKPAFGVGRETSVFIEQTANVEKAVADILTEYLFR